jgi:hypothetical protein
MTISNELFQKIIELQYKEDGELDCKTYSILRKVYFREQFVYEDFMHMKDMSDDREDKLFEYVKMCNPNNKYF